MECVSLQHDPHLIAITETWLNEDITNDEVFPSSYSVIRKDRATRGGGVALLIKGSIKYEQLPLLDDHESVWCKIFLDEIAVIIGVIYRPPGSPVEFIQKIDDHLTALTSTKSRIIMVGDFNLAGIDWEARIPGPLEKPHAECILETMATHSLIQVVDSPTRIQGQCQSLLDLVFLSEETFHYTVEIEEGISDHKIVVATVQIANKGVVKNPIVKVYNFKRADDTSILDLLETALDKMPRGNNVHELWEYFTLTVSECLSRFVPKRKKCLQKTNPWVNRHIIHLKRRLRRARQKRPRNPVAIATLSTDVRKELKTAKKHFVSTTLADYLKNSPQKFWRYLVGSKPATTSVLLNGNICSDPVSVAEAFNNFFNSTYTSPTDMASISQEHGSHCEDDIVISKEGIIELLLKLDVKKSSGPDKIPNEFLKRYCEWVALFLVKIFASSLETGVVPSDWLLARVVPVPKVGDKLMVENYRPISITCTVCKLLEHIIGKHLVAYFENNNLFYNKQHGFRRRLSTVTQLFETVHHFAAAMNSKEQIDVISLDLSKAFDRVCHAKLLNKLHGYGVNLQIIRWIQAYLTNRQHFVEIAGEHSSFLPIPSGVPQGSVLGPILFLLYINDIASGVHPNIEVRLFADDCLLFTRVKTVSDQTCLNDALNIIHNWCAKWDMEINPKKSACMTVSNKKTPLMFDYTVNTNQIKRSTQIKYLGMTITDTLNWNAHIDNICGSAQRKLGLLRRKLRGAPPEVKLQAYKTIVRPTLEYASMIWDPHHQYQIDKLERVQRLAARFIFSVYERRQSITTLLTEVKLPQLAIRRKITRLKFLYQLYNNKLNLNPSLYLRPPGRVSSRTNHPHVIMPYTPRIDTFKNTFLVRTIVDWNCLAADFFENVDTVESFVGKLELSLYDVVPTL